jgi:hypothetical protein
MQEEKISPQEFAKRIKEKYPDYQDMDDLELTNRMLEKFPEYGDMVDLNLGQPAQVPPVTPQVPEGNAWEGASQAAESIAGPLAKGIVDFGRTAVSTAIDMAPQMAEGYVNKEVSNAGESLGFKAAKWLESKLPIKNKSFQDDEQVQADLTGVSKRLESDIQSQKDEAANKMAGVIQDYSKIRSASDVASYIGQALGQAAGQIPAAVLTGGGSSFIMESAIIYDEMIDEIAKKNGNISRQEVYDRGLDKNADSGLMYALTAAGLDAISAGSIMGTFRAAGGKQLTKSAFKKFLGGFLAEGGTEAVQGNIEQLGATQGAGTEYKFDPSGTFNEFLAGGIGGGGLSMVGDTDTESGKATQAAAKLRGKEQAAVIQDAEATAQSESTGDPMLDKSIDEAVMESTHFIDELLDKTDKMDGSKLIEQLDKVTDTANKAEERAANAEFRQFIAEKLNEFNSQPIATTLEERAQELPTIPNSPDTATASAALDPETGNTGLVEDQYLKPEESLIPEQISQPRPKIRRGKPVVEKPVVAPKEETPVIKEPSMNIPRGGRRTKAAVVEAFKEEKKLEGVGKEQLYWPVKNKAGGWEITTKEPKGDRLEPHKSNESAQRWVANQVVREQAATEKMDSEKHSNLTAKYHAQLDNAVKRKPARKLADLEKIGDKAAALGLTEVADRADKLAIKEREAQAAKLEEKEIRKKQNTPKQSKEELAASRVKAREDRIEKESKMSKNKPVTVKPGLAFDKEETMPLNKAKLKFFDKIAQFTQEVKGADYTKQDQENHKKAIEEYKQFRKDNKLPIDTDPNSPQNTDKLIAIGSSSEKAIKNAKKAAEKAKDSATNSYQEAKEKKKDAKNKAKKDIADAFGLSEEDVEDLDFVENRKGLKDVLDDQLEELDIANNQKEEITFEQFRDLAPRGQSGIIQSLFNIVNKYKSKEGSGTKFFKIIVPEGDPGIWGFHFSLSKSDNSYVVIIVDKNGVPLGTKAGRNTLLHEYLHEYTKLMFHRLYATNKNFRNEITKAFDFVTGTTYTKVSNIITKVITRQSISEEDKKLFGTTFIGRENAKAEFDKIFDAYHTEKWNDKRLAMEINYLVEDIFKDFYAFTNPHELMAEILSDPATAFYLSLVKTNDRIEGGLHSGERKSLLYRWYQDLLAFAKRELKFSDVSSFKSVADHFLDTIAVFDDEFVAGKLDRKGDVNMFYDSDIESITNYENAVDEVNFAKSTKSPKVKLNKEIIKNLFSTLKKRTDVNTFNDVKEYIDRINKNFVKAGKPEKQLSDSYAALVQRLITKERLEVKKTKEFQKEATEYAKKDPKYKDSFRYQKDVDGFASVDVDKLNHKQRVDYVSGFTSIAHNMVPSKAAYDVMINFGLMAEKVKALSPTGISIISYVL